MMKLFPTNSFSSGQSQSDSSSLGKTKAKNAFASLLQEGTIGISRSPINDASMGHAEETHEVVSRSDQSVSNRRWKAENRAQSKARDNNSDARAPEKTKALSVDCSRENVHRQTSDENRWKPDPRDRDDDRASQRDESNKLTSAHLSQEAMAQAAAITNVSDIPTLGLPNLALLAKIDPAGQPLTGDYPLVGATLLSPAALGGIEGLETTLLSTQMSTPTPLSEVPTDVLKALGSINQGETPVSSELLKNLGKSPLLQPQEAPAISTTTQVLESSSQTLNQTGQSLLGGSIFQELAQKGVQGALNKGASDSTLGDAEGTPISELPKEFQQAKAVLTNLDARPTVLENHTETLSQMHGYAAEEQEGEVDGESLSTEKRTAPLAGLNADVRALNQNGVGTQPFQIGGEIPQVQNLAQRANQSTAASQQILFEESAPTPEGHISPLTEVMVKVDDDLRIAVRTSGREVMVSMDGSARAIEEMAGIGPELKDSLEDMGFNLSQFSTKEDDGQPLTNDDNAQSKKSSTKNDSDSTTQSNLGPIRQVRRGGQVDTVA
jgi:hypothetical protein